VVENVFVIYNKPHAAHGRGDTTLAQPLYVEIEFHVFHRFSLGYATDQLEFFESGFTFQIFSAYSRIERSDENFPVRATFRIDMRVQALWS